MGTLRLKECVMKKLYISKISKYSRFICTGCACIKSGAYCDAHCFMF